MSELRRYPDYKDSGVPWLGEIPSHWEVIDNKFIFNFSRGLTITKSNLVDEGIPCINYGEVHSKYGFEVDPKIHKLKCVPKEYVEKFDYALLNRGDFIFADTSEDYKGSGNFTYLNSDEVTFAGYHTVVARLKTDDNPRFMAYLFDSNEFRTQVKTRVSGVKVFSITHSILKNVLVWLPTNDEQQAIVNFLDNELKHIDTLIDKQHQLIEKLAEQRSAIITHAVTKGLDPDVPMKGSGVEWLGEIPEHWQLTRLKNSIVSAQNGVWGNEAEGDDNDLVCIRVADFDRKKLIVKNDKLTIRNVSDKDYGNRGLREGDLLLEKSGGGDKQLVGCVVLNNFRGKSVCSNFVAKVSLKENMVPGYWAYHHNVLYQANVNIRSIKQSTGIQNLDATLYFNELACFPPYKEQVEIADYLNIQTQKIDEMSDSNKSIIAKLQEYRSALITQAVTGKIDVRDIAKGNGIEEIA